MKFTKEYVVIRSTSTEEGRPIAYFNDYESAIEYFNDCEKRKPYETYRIYRSLDVEAPLSFAIGDVVHLKSSKKEHIVETPHMTGGYLEYFVTDHGFWESGNKLTLIRRADKESLKKLVDLYKEEYEDEEE